MGRAGQWINGDKRACHVDRNFKVVWFETHITLDFVENTVRPCSCGNCKHVLWRVRCEYEGNNLQSIATFSWDADVYAALRQFHRAKGFDPGSQDVAQDLGAMDPLFAHDSESQVDNQEPVDIDADGGDNDRQTAEDARNSPNNILPHLSAHCPDY
ncbi:hypothetical protein B0H13DRAFT_1861521 [Mycena leptocephala]|nr:hypothetical protein B0H13DRAFT_1861521 [Mycena leptocephala]